MAGGDEAGEGVEGGVSRRGSGGRGGGGGGGVSRGGGGGVEGGVSRVRGWREG